MLKKAGAEIWATDCPLAALQFEQHADLARGDHVVCVVVPSCGHCGPCAEGRPALCEPGAAVNGAGTLLVNNGAAPIINGPATVANTDLISATGGSGTDTPAMRPIALAHWPPQLITTSQAMSPSAVDTPVTLPSFQVYDLPLGIGRGTEWTVALRPSGMMSIEISDSGVGMTPSEIETALRPFGQVDQGFNKKYEGTGLGLPISAALVGLHGGRLTVESEKGKGTRVTVLLPKAAPGQAAQEIVHHPRERHALLSQDGDRVGEAAQLVETLELACRVAGSLLQQPRAPGGAGGSRDAP